MTNVASWALMWLGLGRVARAEEPKDAAAADEMVKLNRVLQIQVGTDRKLFTQEMSHRSLIYQSSANFEVGQELKLVMLLWAGSQLELRGTVRWTRGSTGQIDFQLSAEDESMLVSFLARRSR